MEKKEENLAEISDIFMNEIYKKQNNLFCNHCLGNYRINNVVKNCFQCTRSKCRKRRVIFGVKPFYNTKLDWKTVYTSIFLFLYNFSINQIKKVCLMSRKSIRKILRSVGNALDCGNKMIGGKDVIVEIDESKFGKRKFHRGHRVEGVWVLGMVERTCERKIILVQIEKRDKLTLHDLIKKYVKIGSIIYTDKWKGYLGLEEHGYTHGVVNHSIGFKDELTGIHTNTIEGSWSAIKRSIPVKNRTKQHIQPFLNIFMFNRSACNHRFKKIIEILLNK